MTLLIFTFFIGFFAAILAALPPSATNLAVVKYTSDENLPNALHLAYGASLGEMIVAGLALTFGTLAKRLFETHKWIQITFIVAMFIIGIYFLIRTQPKQGKDESTLPKRFANGLLLGALNIPMFIYWTALIAVISSYIVLNENSPLLLIGLFLLGVFFGKLLTLYLYGRLSDFMTSNFSKFQGKLWNTSISPWSI